MLSCFRDFDGLPLASFDYVESSISEWEGLSRPAAIPWDVLHLWGFFFGQLLAIFLDVANNL